MPEASAHLADPQSGADLDNARDWPELTMPELESELLIGVYQTARVILEYGSGGSTVMGAKQSGKLILSVESDRDWALSLQHKIDAAPLPSQTILYFVDIGETGRWGRPKNNDGWRSFHRYPLGIWSEPFFRQPDVVLIDGRMRPACFVATCLRTKKQPVTILFDDYANRPMYHVIEELAKPAEVVGRMARFEITPRDWPNWAEDFLIELCGVVTLDSGTVDYGNLPDIPLLRMLRRQDHSESRSS